MKDTSISARESLISAKTFPRASPIDLISNEILIHFVSHIRDWPEQIYIVNSKNPFIIIHF